MTVYTLVLRLDGAGLCACRHRKLIPRRETAGGDESSSHSFQTFSITK